MMTKRRIGKKDRLSIANRAKHRCEYCQSWRKYSTYSFEVEHIIPLSRGGKTEPQNLAYACGGCNRHKYNKITALDPVSGNLSSLFHPRQHIWKEHFSWDDDYSLIIGITPIGRATVEALQLNRSGLVNIRKLLRSAGSHPPSDI